MKKVIFPLLFFLTASNVIANDEVITHDFPWKNLKNEQQRFACETLFCIPFSVHSMECQIAMNRFFNLTQKTHPRLMTARIDYLKQCPVSVQNFSMKSIVSSLNEGTKGCDANSLNKALQHKVDISYRFGNTNGREHFSVSGGKACERDRVNKISEKCVEREISIILDRKPAHCIAFGNHKWLELDSKYVGDVLWGGKWVRADQYEEAKIKFDEDKAKMVDELKKVFGEETGH